MKAGCPRLTAMFGCGWHLR